MVCLVIAMSFGPIGVPTSRSSSLFPLRTEKGKAGSGLIKRMEGRTRYGKKELKQKAGGNGRSSLSEKRTLLFLADTLHFEVQ